MLGFSSGEMSARAMELAISGAWAKGVGSAGGVASGPRKAMGARSASSGRKDRRGAMIRGRRSSVRPGKGVEISGKPCV